MKKRLFSMLPKVDEVLNKEYIKDMLTIMPRKIILEAIREEIDCLRKCIMEGNIDEVEFGIKLKDISSNIKYRINNKNKDKLQKVINATGTIIHTNLGRSLLNKDAAKKIFDVATSYSNLEYNVNTRSRGSRYDNIEYIIKEITGAEAAMVVNNNAAAVMLVLDTIAKNKEVIVSRGELVEIGGSFRIPDVMERSGAKLVDVGTTNKTHREDYEKAISEDTSVLLKVHTSNYRIVGFTEDVPLETLVEIGKTNDIPVVEDIGSGVLIDLSRYGLSYEPTVMESIKKGVDIVTFSGDKLLGGPQAGIIVGKKKYIDAMKKNQLTRAFRVDKFTIAALEITFKQYLDDGNAIKNIPTLNMLTRPALEVKEHAVLLKNELDKLDTSEIFNVDIEQVFSQVGGGAMPLERIQSYAIVVDVIKRTSHIENLLRKLDVPIIVRIEDDKLYLDLRTIGEENIWYVVDGFKEILSQIKGDNQ